MEVVKTNDAPKMLVLKAFWSVDSFFHGVHECPFMLKFVKRIKHLSKFTTKRRFYRKIMTIRHYNSAVENFGSPARGRSPTLFCFEDSLGGCDAPASRTFNVFRSTHTIVSCPDGHNGTTTGYRRKENSGMYRHSWGGGQSAKNDGVS